MIEHYRVSVPTMENRRPDFKPDYEGHAFLQANAKYPIALQIIHTYHFKGEWELNGFVRRQRGWSSLTTNLGLLFAATALAKVGIDSDIIPSPDGLKNLLSKVATVTTFIGGMALIDAGDHRRRVSNLGMAAIHRVFGRRVAVAEPEFEVDEPRITA